MIDVALLRENPEVIEKAVKDRNVTADVAAARELDRQYREQLQAVEQLRRALKEAGQGPVSDEVRQALRAQKEQLKEAEAQLETLETARDAAIRELPNIPRSDVPVGKNEHANEVVKTVGEIPQFSFPTRDYLAIAEAHDLIDLERAAKVSGSRFAYLKNEAALLSMGLVRYAFDILLAEKFTPVLPPVIINEQAMAGMGYLEHGGKDETYHFDQDGVYFVGTSEQSIGPMHMNEILDESQLPLRYVAFSNCFRREAGSYGKDTKGILRVHQFDKVEMFSITTPEQSDAEHEYLLSLEEKFMQGLELPYRVMKLCTGDIGWPSARTYDIETWIPSQQRYRETHSTSNTTDYQSRRLKIRYRTKTGEVKTVHMLNGTMVAVNRPIIAILENGQQADGSVKFPKILQPYLFGRTGLPAR